MAAVWTPLVVLGGFAVVMAGFVRLAVVLRRRGGGSVMAPFEEIWRPTAHPAHIEVRQQAQRRAPSPSPGDI